MTITRKTIIAMLLAAGTILVAFICYFIWPPDILSRRAILLASAESTDGERFKIVQFWSYDFYTTRIEQISPDGSVNIAVVDCDDIKQWSCRVQVVEEEKKLIIAIPAGSEPFEYNWEKKWFVLPPGQQRLRD
jgi:hypothetical protein